MNRTVKILVIALSLSILIGIVLYVSGYYNLKIGLLGNFILIVILGTGLGKLINILAPKHKEIKKN